MEAQEKHGRRWNIISGYLNGRPAVHCRNRWLSLLRAGRITDGIQQAAAMFDTSTLRPVAPGSQSECLISPSSSPTPSQCSSGIESSLDLFFNSWEDPAVFSSPKSTENYPEGLPADFGYYDNRAISSQHGPHGHHRSESSSSNLSWTSSFSSADFGIGLMLDQTTYSQGTPETVGAAIPGAPSQPEPPHTIMLTPPLETQSESLIMTCSLPYCTFQSTNLTDIWRHMTWDHIGNKTYCPPEMSALVEKVVIGSGSVNN
jgi:hypothetical protein